MKKLTRDYLHSLDAANTTKQTYARGVEAWLKWCEREGVDPTAATLQDAKAYKQSLIAAGYKPATVNIKLAAVRSLYTYLEDMGAYDGNAGRVKSAKSSHNQTRRSLTATELIDVIKSHTAAGTVTDLRNRAALMLMGLRGLRTCEIVRANLEDIQVTQGVAVLYVRGKGRTDAADPVVLGEAISEAIAAYLKAAGRAAADPTEPLFTSTSNRNQGARLTTRSVRNIAAAAFEATGVKSQAVTAHSLRHTCITLALVGGATVQEAQQLARHKSIETTMIYAHNLDRLAGHAEAAIDNLVEATDAPQGSKTCDKTPAARKKVLHVLPAESYKRGAKSDKKQPAILHINDVRNTYAHSMKEVIQA
jgi:integrase/recombinase XerC